MLLAFNKPYGVLSQFTADGSPNRTLAEFGFPKGVYPIGRLDADSEGHEGKFYVWTPAEIEAVLGKERAEIFCYVYDVSSQGNFEHGQSILNLPKTISQCAALKGFDPVALREAVEAWRTG